MSAFFFRVHAEPKGQPRVKATARGGFVRMYTPKTADGFKSAVEIAAMEKGLRNKHLEGPIRLTLLFRMPRPKSHFRTGKNSQILKEPAPYHHICKPDLDNIEKALKDALSDAGVWVDDCQVCEVSKRKIYVTGQEAPVSDVLLEQIEVEP